MKFKRILALVLALGIVFALGACTSDDAEEPDAGDAAPEDGTEEQDPAAETTQPEDAQEEPTGEAQTEAEAGVTVTIYTGNDNADGLDETEVAIAELTADELLAALVDAGAIPEGTTCVSFTQSDDGSELTLDLSQAFADGVGQMGTSGEMMMLGSLVNTFLEAYDAQTITVTVEGAALETGHNVYDTPLERYSFEMTGTADEAA